MITLSQLRRCDLASLEELYAHERAVSLPAGRYRGVPLARLESSGARNPFWRLTQVPFSLAPFAVDFTARHWLFFHRLALGKFEPSVGASRWRETVTVRLDYSGSRLPAPVRNLLYDEVKPLSETLCLGLGGVNAPRGRGDHFFFALDRADPRP